MVSAVSPAQHSQVTPFGRVAIGNVDLVSGTSAFARNVISTINLITRHEDQPQLSALGLTTVMSFVGGSLILHNGWCEGNVMRRIGDAVGSALADLKCLRGGVQAVAGALFLPVRVLSMLAHTTASKSLRDVAGLLGQIGVQLFSVTSLLLGVNAAVELHAEFSFMHELNAIYEREPGSPEAKAGTCLAFLQAKLLADENLVERNSSILARAVGEKCVTEILAATPADAQVLITKIFAVNQYRMHCSMIMIALCIMGIAANIIPLITAAQGALIVASGLNALITAIWLGFDLYQVIDAFEHSLPGKYDAALLGFVSLTSISAISLSVLIEEGKAMQAVSRQLRPALANHQYRLRRSSLYDARLP